MMCGNFTTSTNDFSQANDLAAKEPERLEEMKELFLKEAEGQQGLPYRCGYLASDPSGRSHQDALHKLALRRTTTRMPEFAAPGLGRESNHVTIDAELATMLRAFSMRSAARAAA